MLGAFLYLTVCSIRNRIRIRLRRLRQPRYLIGSIVGGLYLYSVVFRQGRSRSGHRPPGMLAALGQLGGPIELVGTVLLFAIAAAAWATPGAGRPIEFSRAEVQFLFQAPVSRRQLLHYKLLRGQVGVFFGSAVATLFLRPATFATAWTFLVGMWLLFAIARLHFIGVALRRQSLAQHGASGVRRQWLPLGIVLAAVTVLAAAVVSDWPALSAMESGWDELRRLASTGAAWWILWPFRTLVRLPLAGSTAAFLGALPAALLLLALNYLWVLRGDASFEEASAAYAEKRATERATPAGAGRKLRSTAPPFELAASGRPEVAILWKNLIMLGRYASLRMLLRFVPLLVVGAIVISRQTSSSGVVALIATGSLIAAAMLTLLGPQIMRNDLRQDLANLAVLKTWPVRGAALIRGELLAPTVVLTVVVWLMILFGGLFADAGSTHRAVIAVVASRWSYALAAMLIAPVVILTQLVVHNGIAVMFPAWVTVGTARARGIDAMGQRMLMMAGILLTLAISLLPAALLAGAVGLGIYVLLHVIPVIVPAAIVAIVMTAECVLAIEALGRVLERTDVSALEAVE